MSTEDYELEGDDNVVALDSLGHYKPRRGMSGTMRDVYDVLYEAGEPLSPEVIASRTFERASGAAKFHARRWYLRRLDRDNVTSRDRGIITRGDVEVGRAWTAWIKQLLRDAALPRDGRLIRNQDGQYAPNLRKPGRAARVDGTTYPYTREAWEQTTSSERTTGEIHTMTMEVERFLGNRDRDELLLVLEILVDDLAGFGKEKQRPLNPRTVRAQLRWLLERPTTDESRAWLLHELTRRIYES